MLTAFLIIAFSLVMLLYWFRYSCILILRNQLESQPATAATTAASDIQERLRNTAEWDALHRELERDYKVLTYLLEHAAGLELASFEHKLLIWDCRMMQCVYRITRTAAPNQARNALAEVAEVLGLLGNHLRERAGAASETI